MKKLNTKSFFKKIKSVDSMNRLLTKVYREFIIASQKEKNINNTTLSTKNKEDKLVEITNIEILVDVPPYFPNVDDIKDDKQRVSLFTNHLLGIDPEFRLVFIDYLRIINNIIDNESIKIIEELAKDKVKYELSGDDKAYVLASENNIDKAFNYYTACANIINDTVVIREFYKKNNWTRYEAKSSKEKDNEKEKLTKNIIENNESQYKQIEKERLNIDDSLDLLSIELNNSFTETLRDDINNIDIETTIYNYNDMHLAYIRDNKDEVASLYIVYIPEIDEVMIKGKSRQGKAELLFTLAESYMRMAHYININPLTISYDAIPFKLKGDNMAPIKHNIMLKSWQVKSVELINLQSAQSFSVKLPPSIEYSGMIQMWQFLQTLGNVKDLNNYEVNKISIVMEINDVNANKGYDRLNININKNGANLNMLYPTHRKAYQILLASDISLGFVEGE